MRITTIWCVEHCWSPWSDGSVPLPWGIGSSRAWFLQGQQCLQEWGKSYLNKTRARDDLNQLRTTSTSTTSLGPWSNPPGIKAQRSRSAQRPYPFKPQRWRPDIKLLMARSASAQDAPLQKASPTEHHFASTWQLNREVEDKPLGNDTDSSRKRKWRKGSDNDQHNPTLTKRLTGQNFKYLHLRAQYTNQSSHDPKKKPQNKNVKML